MSMTGSASPGPATSHTTSRSPTDVVGTAVTLPANRPVSQSPHKDNAAGEFPGGVTELLSCERTYGVGVAVPKFDGTIEKSTQSSTCHAPFSLAKMKSNVSG